MAVIYLLGSQKNEIARGMSKRGLSPSEFSWEERRSTNYNQTIEALVHRRAKFYCAFDGWAGSRICICSPGTDAAVKESASVASWNAQHGAVVDWLNNVKREMEAPDPWSATFEGAAPIADQEWEVDNTPVTDAERQAISARLRELETSIFATYRLSVEEKQVIQTRLAYLEEAAKRQGRKDWIHTAIGVSVTIGFSFATTPQLARDVLAVVSKLAQVLFGPSFPQLTP
jgi:hypothetical protein